MSVHTVTEMHTLYVWQNRVPADTDNDLTNHETLAKYLVDSEPRQPRVAADGKEFVRFGLLHEPLDRAAQGRVPLVLRGW